jgi:hypothetical protein
MDKYPSSPLNLVEFERENISNYPLTTNSAKSSPTTTATMRRIRQPWQFAGHCPIPEPTNPMNPIKRHPELSTF